VYKSGVSRVSLNLKIFYCNLNMMSLLVYHHMHSEQAHSGSSFPSLDHGCSIFALKETSSTSF
jgi:hypothetical protein